MFKANKNLIAEFLGRTLQGHKMYFHDLEVMGSNPSRSILGTWYFYLSCHYNPTACVLALYHLSD